MEPSRGPADAPTLLIYGHYDVQPAEISEGWTSDPFEPEIRGGRIYARGAGDNKGQHFAQVKAVEAYGATGTPLPINVKFLIEGEEEMGSTNLGAFVKENKNLLGAVITRQKGLSTAPP